MNPVRDLPTLEHMKSSTLTYEYSCKTDFSSKLVEHFRATLQEKFLYKFQHEGGQGKILSIEIEDGFEIELVQMTLTQPLDVCVNPSNTPNKWNVTICSDFVYESNNPQFNTTGFPTGFPYCVVLSSSSSQNTRTIPAHKAFFTFSITFSQQWIQQNIIVDLNPMAAKHVAEMMQNQTPVLLVDHIDFELHKVLETLLTEDIYDQITKLVFYKTALDLTITFFKKLISKSIFTPNQNFKKKDIQKIQQINNLILEDLSKPCPTIEQLSKAVGMSTAKFKTLYKAVYNNSVYSYHLNERLAQSCKYLQSGKYTINEVAYMVGFNYASSFSRIFKKTYGKSPMQFLGVNYIKC